MATDTIDEEIDNIISELKMAKKAESYRELDKHVSNAEKEMEALRTDVNIEGTQMESGDELDLDTGNTGNFIEML